VDRCALWLQRGAVLLLILILILYGSIDRSLMRPWRVLLERVQPVRRLRWGLCRLLLSATINGRTAACALDRPLRVPIARPLVLPHLGVLRLRHRIRISLRYVDLRMHVSRLRCGLRGRLLAWARRDDDSGLRGMHLPCLRSREGRLHRRWLRPVWHAISVGRIAVWLRRRRILAVRVALTGLRWPVVTWVHG
jgi:hypothetical protein